MEGVKPKDDPESGLVELLTRRRAQFALLLYLLFPLFAGFISAMQGSGRTGGWPLGFRIAYYLPLALVVMWSSGLACHLLARFARAVRAPLWLLLIVGVLVAGEFIKMYVAFVVPIFDKLLPVSAVGGRVAEFTLLGNLQAALPTIVTWLCLNLLAWKVFGIERFGYPAPPSMFSSRWSKVPSDEQKAAEPRPAFLSRARIASIEHVKALEAQQHYIKIYTDAGTKTILYRFGDAVAEIAPDVGLQVHRSWWVHRDHVEGMEREGDRLFLTMGDDLEVPVSRTYALDVKKAFG